MTYTSLGEAHSCLVCAHQLRPSRDRLDTAFQALGLVKGLSLSINTLLSPVQRTRTRGRGTRTGPVYTVAWVGNGSGQVRGALSW